MSEQDPTADLKDLAGQILHGISSKFIARMPEAEHPGSSGSSDDMAPNYSRGTFLIRDAESGKIMPVDMGIEDSTNTVDEEPLPPAA
jgi:hypothetical protein